ncbi:hypothetical protein H9P43_008715 [Blastocladiella emersonii ATCC 22665]|nr:hypothetical protein H9P43_008715 [Blastocladiella emersonii ATCC 22665]
MARAQPVFIWSPASALAGMTLLMYSLALVTSTRLYLRTKTRYYAILSGVALGRVYITIALTATYASPEMCPVEYSLIATLLEGICGSVFVCLNVRRLYVTCYKRYKRAVQILLFGAAAAVTLLATCTVWYLTLTWNSYFAAAESKAANEAVYTSWFIVDCLVNSSISLLFVLFLRDLTVVPAGGVTMRSDMVGLTRHIQFLLLGEVSLILFTTIGRFVDPGFDPSWFTFFFADAVRLRIFSSFLDGLNRVMKNGNNSRRPTTADSSSNSASASRASKESETMASFKTVPARSSNTNEGGMP